MAGASAWYRLTTKFMHGISASILVLFCHVLQKMKMLFPIISNFTNPLLFQTTFPKSGPTCRRQVFNSRHQTSQGQSVAKPGTPLQNIVVCNLNPTVTCTLREFDPDTAYVVCTSVSLGFRQKPSDTALLSVIAFTTFKYIFSASVTKGVLVFFVVTVHWWRYRTHYDVTKAYRALRNILTAHLNNRATRADLRGIPKHCDVGTPISPLPP